MATNLITGTLGIRVFAVSGQPKPDRNRQKSSSYANWWAPLFGWASETDYIDAGSKPQAPDTKKEGGSAPDPEQKPVRTRFAPGCFTEEKAKQLRMMTTESFHDAMYHSAIASRLASDFKNHSDP